MRIYQEYTTRPLFTTSHSQLNRRRFFKSMAIVTTLYALPSVACKRFFGKNEIQPNKYTLSDSEKEIIMAVQQHLLPDDEDGPGAQNIHAIHHFEFVLKDKHLDEWERKILLNGIKWVDETAHDLYNKNFTSLNFDEKEHVLRDLETYKNGERWLSFLLGYLFEALAGSPAYSVNPDGIGWKWLNHVQGYPQPEANQIYGTYGYGL